ncbi:hypothetical protein KQI84_09510 [bacterium]|nr:hypothetical protein [bacterium]
MARKARKKAAPKAAPARMRPAVELLVELERQKAQFEKEHAEMYREMLEKAIEEKTDELEKARIAREQAQAKEANLEEVLAGLKADLANRSGKAKAPTAPKPAKAPTAKKTKKARGRKPAAKKPVKKAAAKKSSGRKQRVDIDTKRKYVADALKSYPKGVAFSTLRDKLAKMTLPGSKSAVFGAVDLNSSATFGKRLLPRGWKVQGSHRSAKVVKK